MSQWAPGEGRGALALGLSELIRQAPFFTFHFTFYVKYIHEVLPLSICFSGNLLGPVVNSTIEGGLDRFFRQPHGCGEQTMIYSAPNVYVLEYLMRTKKLTEANEQNAQRFIQFGKLKKICFTLNVYF